MRRFVGVLLACVLLAGCGGGNGGGSLDGKIAFMSDRDGDLEVFVMNADGTGVSQLTDNDVNDGWPVWSPDGRRVVHVFRGPGSAAPGAPREKSSFWFFYTLTPQGHQLQNQTHVFNTFSSTVRKLTGKSGWFCTTL